MIGISLTLSLLLYLYTAQWTLSWLKYSKYLVTHWCALDLPCTATPVTLVTLTKSNFIHWLWLLYLEHQACAWCSLARQVGRPGYEDEAVIWLFLSRRFWRPRGRLQYPAMKIRNINRVKRAKSGFQCIFRANVTFSFDYVYTGYTSYRIRPRFTHKNGDFGAISAMERRCAAPRRSHKWSVTYWIGSVSHLGAVWTEHWNHWGGSKYSGVRIDPLGQPLRHHV